MTTAVGTMRACVKTGMGRVEVVDLPVPQAGPGQIVVKTTLATICGSDIHILDEFPMPDGAPPLPMGHEAVGVVHQVGEGVTGLQPGDRVVASCLMGCGACENCRRGDVNICLAAGLAGPGTNLLFGGQSQYFLVRGADFSAAKIPDDVTDRQAVLTADIMSTGFGAAERGGIAVGDTVAVFAQGPVGLCATAGARLRGAGRIIAVEAIPERAALARRFGADHVVAPAGAVEEIMRLTGGRGVDVAIEALGHQQTFESCLAVTRWGGTVSSVGVYSAFPALSLPTSGSFLHRNIVTTFCPSGTDRLRRLMEVQRTGKVDLTPLFTHEMPLEAAPEAYEMFRAHRDGVLKIALTP